MKLTDYRVYELSKKERTEFLIAASILISLLLYLFYNTAVVFLPAALCAVYSLRFYEAYKAAKRKDLLISQFRDLLYSLSASVGAGRHMTEALAEARSDLRLLYDEDTPMIRELAWMNSRSEAANESAEEMLLDLGRRSGVRDITTFAEVYRICISTGGDLVKVIGITSQMLLDKLTIVRDIESYTAQKRFEGKVIALLPPLIILFLNMTAPDYLAPMYGSLQGREVMTAALLSMVCGYAVSGRITDIGMWRSEDEKSRKRIFCKNKIKKAERTRAAECHGGTSRFYQQARTSYERRHGAHIGSDKDRGGRGERLLFLQRIKGDKKQN